MQLGIDYWNDIDHSHEDVEASDFEQVEGFIRRLDQDKHTIVSLGEVDQPCLMVAGGRGDYIVTATLDGESWATLVMGPRGGPRRRINTGGQPGDFESHEVATFDQSLAAARYFFLHTALDPALTWET